MVNFASRSVLPNFIATEMNSICANLTPLISDLILQCLPVNDRPNIVLLDWISLVAVTASSFPFRSPLASIVSCNSDISRNSMVQLAYTQDDDEETRAAKLIEALHDSPILWGTKRALTRGADLTFLTERPPLAARLRSLIHSLDCSAKLALQHRIAADEDAVEPLDAVRSVRVEWDSRRRRDLEAIANRLSRPLIRRRQANAHDNATPLHQTTYDSTQLLDMLCSIANPNTSSAFNVVPCFGAIRLALKTPTFVCFQSLFTQLEPHVRHIGLDDSVAGLEWFHSQKLALGEHLLATGTHDEMATFAQTGIPASVRPRLWRRLLGVWTSERDFVYYEGLAEHVRDWDMITDDLYRINVKDTANDAAYFVFEVSKQTTTSGSFLAYAIVK
jgi:hypothetical protein